MKETVPESLAGQRLDRIVAMLADLSRVEAAALVDGGQVTVAGKVVTTRSYRLSAGETLEFEPPEARTPDVQPEPDVPVAVVHEDADLLVVDKPAGLVVHPGAGQPGGTLVNGLLARYPELAAVGQEDRPGVVHRLDRGTSGLLLVARSPQAYDQLVAMLSARQVERRYRALVWGRVAAPAGTVDAPIGRSPNDRTRMTVTLRGKPAVTHYEVRRRFEQPVEVTELACALATGRTHQIRVHMASIDHPIVGDDRYGGRHRLPTPLELARPWLHAERLSLSHPISGKPLAFESPLPDELTAVLRELGSAEPHRESGAADA